MSLDGPLCARKTAMLRRHDGKGSMRFTEIVAADFDSSALGVDNATLMASIHGRSASVELITGVEGFRRICAALGFERLVRLSRASWIGYALERAYALFAAYRQRLTGRCHDDEDTRQQETP